MQRGHDKIVDALYELFLRLCACAAVVDEWNSAVFELKNDVIGIMLAIICGLECRLFDGVESELLRLSACQSPGGEGAFVLPVVHRQADKAG